MMLTILFFLSLPAIAQDSDVRLDGKPSATTVNSTDIPAENNLADKKSEVKNDKTSKASALFANKSEGVKNKPRWNFGWEKGRPFLRSPNKNFEARLSGYIQFDGRGFGAKPEAEKTMLVRRARIGVEGTIYRNLEFKMQADFSQLKLISMRDIYVKYRVRDEFQIWFGHMKEPWGQEELHSDSALEFVERSMVNNLVPSRNIGIMVSGVFRKGIFQYELGAFSGNKKFAREPNDPAEGVIRVRFSPWIKSGTFWTKGLSFGGAFTQNQTENGKSVRGRSASRGFTFFKAESINGTAIRSSAELSWLAGPASFRAEYDQTHQERRGLGQGDTNLPGIVAKGFMTQLTFLLTGETKPDSKNVKPKHNFFESENGRRGLGAWELKLRYDNLEINDSTIKSNRAESVYFGANWYLNSRVRYMLDFGFERFKDSLQRPQPGDGTSFVILSRLQFAF